jgi:hypothetical protein
MSSLNRLSAASSKELTMHQTFRGRRLLERLAHANRLFIGTGLLAAAWAALALPVSPARADDCPNGGLRALNGSSGLPDCRAYEMVTSPFKEGFKPQLQSYTDGGVYTYFSVGSFAGNPYGSNSGNQYVATRSAGGWTTVAHNPPGDQWIFQGGEAAEDGISKDGLSSVWMMRPYARPADPDGVYVRRPDGVFSFIGTAPATPRPHTVAASADLSHLVVSAPADVGQPDNLYEYTDNAHAPRRVGVDNTGAPLPFPGAFCAQGISEDGRVIFFMAGGFPSCVGQLWARVGGTTTIELAASQCTRTAADPGGACNSPAPLKVEGFAVDGSRVLFTTTQQLVDGDTDATNDLYACDVPPGTPAPTGPVNACPNLHEVSAGTGGADVQSVVRVADDGYRVYFTARGVLAGNRGANDEVAAAGELNLYVWQTDADHPAGRTTFAARLLSTDTSVAVNGNVETTPDGRYLLLNSLTRLVTSGVSADTDSASDAYRYDAETGEWLRLTTNSDGGGGNAEIDAYGRGQTKPNHRPRVSITADGRTVVFQTEEALSSADHNNLTDVYAWHGGRVSLISADGGGSPLITSSGTDIFFTTTRQLTAADGDTNPDVYDARVNGGFDLSQPAPCEGEGCLGQRSSPPGLADGTGGLGGQGNAQESAPRFTLRSISATQRRALASTGRVTLTVTASKPGVVAARATVTSAGKARSVAAARQSMAAASSVQLTLTLSKSARARLAAKRRLAVKVVVSHSRFALPRSLTLNLTASGKAKKSGERSAGAKPAAAKGGRS